MLFEDVFDVIRALLHGAARLGTLSEAAHHAAIAVLDKSDPKIEAKRAAAAEAEAKAAAEYAAFQQWQQWQQRAQAQQAAAAQPQPQVFVQPDAGPAGGPPGQVTLFGMQPPSSTTVTSAPPPPAPVFTTVAPAAAPSGGFFQAPQ